MTTTDAKVLAATVIPELSNPEAITPEGLVKLFYDTAICVLEDETFFRVYGAGVLTGQSTAGPIEAWYEASVNLPSEFLEGFEDNFEFYRRRVNDQTPSCDS